MTLPISVRNLIKQYGQKTAVAGIDLDIRSGICFGLLGPNGAGKTTTVEMLEGLHDPTSGEMKLFGHKWKSGHDHEIRNRMGVQLQWFCRHAASYVPRPPLQLRQS